MCVKLHSRALGVQLWGLITFSRMNISGLLALKIFQHGPRLISESLSLIACSRKMKCEFYETSFFSRFWYYFANILSHRQNFSKPYTLFLSLGVRYTHANFQLNTSFQPRVLYYTPVTVKSWKWLTKKAGLNRTRSFKSWFSGLNRTGLKKQDLTEQDLAKQDLSKFDH